MATFARHYRAALTRGLAAQRYMLGKRARTEHPAWRGLPVSQRLRTLVQTPPASEEGLTNTQETALAWVQVYEQSPASYGVNTFDGYLEMAPSGAHLPFKATETLESAFDYITHDSIPVCCRASLLDAPVEIGKVELHGIRKAKKADTKVKVTLELGKDLVGTMTAQDVFTKSRASIEFQGRTVLRARVAENALICS